MDFMPLPGDPTEEFEQADIAPSKPRVTNVAASERYDPDMTSTQRTA